MEVAMALYAERNRAERSSADLDVVAQRLHDPLVDEVVARGVAWQPARAALRSMPAHLLVEAPALDDLRGDTALIKGLSKMADESALRYVGIEQVVKLGAGDVDEQF